MAHPGKIVYAHPPGTDGVRFFYITFSRRTNMCEVRGKLEDGSELSAQLPAREMLELLQNVDNQWSAEVSRRALRPLHDLVERRDL